MPIKCWHWRAKGLCVAKTGLDIFNPDLEATKYNKELIFAVRSNPNSNFGTSDIGMNFLRGIMTWDGI